MKETECKQCGRSMDGPRQAHSKDPAELKPAIELDSLLAGLAELSRRRGAPVEVRQQLLKEVQSLRSSPPGRFAGWAPQALLWVAAVAAVVAAAGSFLAPLQPRLSEKLSSIHGRSVDEMPAAPLDDLQRVAPSDADYVSLPYSDPSIANGTQAIVRISVAASELMAWGVPSVAKGPDEDVPADLVLGDDGLPQAIRVLPVTSSTSTAEENYP